MLTKKNFFIITPFGDKDGVEEDKATFDMINGLKENVIDRAVGLCRSDYRLDVCAEDGRAYASGDHIWTKIGEQLSQAAGVIGIIATGSLILS